MGPSCDLGETPDCFNNCADDFVKWLLLLVVFIHAHGRGVNYLGFGPIFNLIVIY